MPRVTGVLVGDVVVGPVQAPSLPIAVRKVLAPLCFRVQGSIRRLRNRAKSSFCNSLILKFAIPPSKQSGQSISETKPVLQSMGALQQCTLAWLGSGYSHSNRLLFRSSGPIGINIDSLKHFAQRYQSRAIELRANGNVEDCNSVRRQVLFNELVKFARAQIGWNAKFSKCIQQNDVVKLLLMVEVS